MGSRILIVDDNQEIREVVTVLLENEGYEVEAAGDGEAGAPVRSRVRMDRAGLCGAGRAR